MTNIDINETFIRYSSPTMCGIKPANMFVIPLDSSTDFYIQDWKRDFEKLGLSISAIKTSASSMLIFIYDFLWIRKLLSDTFVAAYLRGKGYKNIEATQTVLEELFRRLQITNNFPHDVGVFLGYPIEDVINFEANQGKHCKYCGYWKSYCNPEEAKKCCERYKCCSQMCKQWFEEGLNVTQIIKKYKEVAEKAA